MIIINDEQKNSIYLDEGYFFGRGLFETILVVKGRAIFLQEHLDRLQRGIEFLGLKVKLTEEQVKAKINFYYQELKKDYFVFKIIVSEKNIVFSCRQYIYDYEKPASVKVGFADYIRGNNPIYSYKTTNYLENILTLEKGRDQGYFEILMLNPYNQVLEGCISNVFFLINGDIVTAPVDLGLLDGVVRRWVINNFMVREKAITTSDLKKIEAAFLTNSLIGITPINQLGEKALCSLTNSKILDIFYAYRSFIELSIY